MSSPVICGKITVSLESAYEAQVDLLEFYFESIARRTFGFWNRSFCAFPTS